MLLGDEGVGEDHGGGREGVGVESVGGEQGSEARRSDRAGATTDVRILRVPNSSRSLAPCATGGSLGMGRVAIIGSDALAALTMLKAGPRDLEVVLVQRYGERA